MEPRYYRYSIQLVVLVLLVAAQLGDACEVLKAKTKMRGVSEE